jgi:hypothetical protein
MCKLLYWSPSCLTPNYYHSELKFWYFKVDSALEITTIQQNWTKLLQQNWPKVLRGEKIGRHVRLVSSSWDLNTISLNFCVGRNWTTSAVSDSTSCIAWDAMILWEHQFVELAGKLLWYCLAMLQAVFSPYYPDCRFVFLGDFQFWRFGNISSADKSVIEKGVRSVIQCFIIFSDVPLKSEWWMLLENNGMSRYAFQLFSLILPHKSVCTY